jgi:Leucine-rich repeat (LRR) protein
MTLFLSDFEQWIRYNCDNHKALKIYELNLRCNNLTTVSKEICNLINLQTLLLSKNKLTTIPKEIYSLKNLFLLDLEYNNLTEIPENNISNLINLGYLNLAFNNFTTIPKEISSLKNLKYLYLYGNKINTIPKEICNLINLKILNLGYNNFTKIPDEICNLINLRILDLKYNNITIINNKISNLVNLKYLDLSKNKLTTISNEITNLVNLEKLYLGGNKLTTIPKEMGNLINLETLFLHENNLITLPIEITNIRNANIYYANNPIEYLPPQVVRYLERNKTTQKIYNDNQSVHNHSIQEGVENSINYVMSIKPIYKLENINDVIIDNNYIDNQTKTILFEYINCKDIHSTLNITFSELLINILSFIEQHEAKQEIYKILEQEMNDTLCKCFTGRMSRLINCLNGFDDNIVINISNNEQIGNIIILIKEKLLAENNYTIELHKEIVMKELYDRGYDKGIVNEWLDYI